MENKFPETGSEESFWDDVASIHAMLDAEDAEQGKKEVSERFAPSEFPKPQPVRPSGPERPAPMKSSERKQLRTPRRSSAGALAVLYIILLLEIAGIGGILYSWYTWIH